MSTSDEALALAAAQGDGGAFSTLLSRHYDRVFAFAFRLTGHRAEAEDLTQDICAALPAKLRSFQGTARFTTWLYRVTVNAAHDRRRRAATHARAAEGWGDWEVARQAEIADQSAANDWLAQAMQALPTDLRDTVALVLGEDLTQAQAAEVLGISEGTIAWRMSQVKKHLRALHQKEEQA
ncbi:RNA polymerase sigma70 [Actibacterium mucosum KCTC 23349]|uniref:RNA polymerase sigma70 n=1 Tax=Actibacterium mucosum KCTC 23349 TaxID=1454373 RepID=A0A037ZEQ4_9RHOB|nr:RNA polymerase sigma factor [Actibacterium mucosum]KAJ54935.1 RNA polymerase sigma70 [Actibacterium mucosum KCTC 23349]